MNNGSSDDIRQLLADFIVASDRRMTRIEQIVESNNRFLETFGQNVERFRQIAENLAQSQNAIIATSNSDRQEANIQLGRIQRKVDAIADRLGVGNEY